MSPIRRKKALDEYLDSYGETLPNDWHEYSVGNTKEYRCLFCDDYHDNHIIPKINLLDNTERTDLGIFSCEADNQYVQQLRHQLGLEDVPPPIDRDDNDHSNKRLQLLINGLKFDPEVYKYYTHLDNRDRYAVSANKCYLCDDYSSGHTIDVPVKFGGELSGGKVNICNDCEHDIKDIEYLYQSLLIKTFLYKETCPQCTKPYYIEEAEFEYRFQKTKEVGVVDFLCPECAHFTINNISDTDALYNFENASPRHKVPDRFVELPSCTCCRRNFRIDLTLQRFFIDANYSISPTKYICSECAKAGFRDLLVSGLTVQLTSNLYIRFILSVFWEYEVFRFAKYKSEMELLLTGKTETDEIAEAGATAINETYLLLSGEQLDLWKSLWSSQGE